MDFGLSPEQRQRAAEIERVVAERLSGQATGVGVDRERWQVAADLGLTGACLPVERGGAGLGALDTALSLEAFGRACADMGLVFAVAAHLLAVGVPIRDFGSPALADEVLEGLATGTLVGANAMTEDGAGSDVGALATVASSDGDDYVLTGEKSWVSNAPYADVFVTYAVTDPDAGFLGLSAFAVPRDAAGVVVGEPLAKAGLPGCGAARVRFADCRVPSAFRLGADGSGSQVFQHSMAWERAVLFGAYVGLMDRQLEQCVRHAKARRQFGRPIGDFQAVSHRLVEMAWRLESARLLLYRACWLLDSGDQRKGGAALAKLATSEAAVQNSLDAAQVFGSTGVLVEAPAQRQLRDTLPARVFSGTSDMQREIVATELGL